jgi:hypothetical protein
MRVQALRSLRLAIAALLGGAALALALTPAAATAATGNAATTQAYVQANYTGLRAAIAHLASSEAGPVHVLEQVQRECPGAGAGSPQNSESTQMSNEVIGAMVLAAYKPDFPAIRTFVRSVAGLSWSNRALSQAIRSYAADWKTILSLQPPNLCSEVKAWGADGYRALPASTVSFVTKFIPAWVGAGFLPPQLSRYESSATRALAQRSEPLETQVSEAEARAVAHYGAIMNTLEIWP